MNINEVYPSNYLKAIDLQNRDVPVVINQVQMETIGNDEKPVIYFQGKQKGVVLNKTNATNIAQAYGDDMDYWQGKPVILFPAWVDFQGKSVQAIRMRPGTGGQPPAAPQQRQAAPRNGNGAGLPHPGIGNPPPANGYGMPAGGPPAGHPADLDDDIPFAPSFV